ncbi:hypothetical protein GGR58DRAFT_147874 [Xylaria digitata]|nr:hypothetical protein GGR58DRAFT_147874 [Xylaria digitata]
MDSNQMQIAALGSQDSMHNFIKASRLLDGNLPDILSYVPVTANCMGTLRILAFSKEACLTKQISPGKYVTQDNLPANLDSLVQKGMDAFNKAQCSMDTIRLNGEAHFGRGSTVSRIIGCLTNKTKAKAMLGPNVAALKKAVERCADVSADVVKDFDEWKMMAQELNELITGQLVHFEKQKTTDQEEAQRTKIWEKHYQSQKDIAEKEKKKYEERWEKAVKEFRKELKKQTSTRRNLGAVVASEGLNVGFGAVNGLINIVTAVPNVALEGLKAIGNLGSLGQGGNPYADRVQSSQPQVGGDRPTTNSRLPSDAAFIEANRVLTTVQNFEYICRLDFGTPEQIATNSALLQDAVDQIRRLRKDIDGLNTPGSIHICTAILDPILAIGEDAMKVFEDGLDKDSYNATVSNWIARCKGPHTEAIAFKAKADSQPGQAFGGIMPNLQWQTPANPQTKLADSQQLLEKKAQMMATMKLAMEAAKRDYDAQALRVAMTDEKLTELTSSLAQLMSGQDMLQEVNKLLRKAIKVISELQDGVRRLVSYFHGISATIGVVVTSDCDHYLNLVQTLGSDLGNEELLQVCAEELFHALVGLRGNFAVVHANACFYQEVSTKYIMPAMQEVCGLPIDQDMDAQIEARKKLEEATNNAASRIRQLGLDERTKLLASLDSGIQAIETEARNDPFLLRTMNRQQKVIQDTVHEVERERNEASRQVFEVKIQQIDDDIAGL